MQWLVGDVAQPVSREGVAGTRVCSLYSCGMREWALDKHASGGFQSNLSPR